MNYGKICVLLLVVMPAVFAKTDYCSAKLCRNGKKHIACVNKNGEFASTCQSPQIIEMTPELKARIVNKHNSMRNDQARGYGKFPPAAHMATMVWDDELAALAELNVKQCEMSHDQCRSTERFKFAGQNLAMEGWAGMELSIEEVIDGGIDAWFDEHKDCPLDIIKNNTFKTNGKVIGHFTALVQDKSAHIGCAALRSKDGDMTLQFLACDYSYTNMMNRPVYEIGPTASKCITGVNKQYPGLCSPKEKYKLN